jgi:hypothetical protein
MPGRAFGIDALVGVEFGGDGGKNTLPAGVDHELALSAVAVEGVGLMCVDILRRYFKYLIGVFGTGQIGRFGVFVSRVLAAIT